MTAAYKYRKDCLLVWSSSEGRGTWRFLFFIFVYAARIRPAGCKKM